MDKCFNKEVCTILENAEKEMLNLRHPYVGTEHLLLSLLKRKNIISICNKVGLTYNSFREELIRVIGCASKKSEVILYTPLLKKVIDKAFKNANDDDKELNDLYLFSSMLNESDGIALRIVDNMDIDVDKLIKEIASPKLLPSLGICLNDKSIEQIYLRDKELDEIMEILLRKNKNNPILVGPAGVGKTALVYELARRIKNKEVPLALQDKLIYLVSTSSLVSGTKYRGEFEERINNLIEEVIKHKNIILFIDEIHTIMKTGGGDSSIDAANILKPYLARDDIKIIGATTIEEYNEYIKKDGAFARRFSKILIKEPSLSEMEILLNKVKINYEKYYNLKIDDRTINYLIEGCNRYLPNQYNPDKCIDVLDTACAQKELCNYKNKTNKKLLDKKDIYNIFKKKTNICDIDKNKLVELKNKLIDNYNENNIKKIINFIKSDSLNKYMIFNGEDAKSKIKLIKDISVFLNINLLNIDCKDYSDQYSLNKLIGNNFLYNKISDNPFSIIVFDNYNEASKVLYNLINTMISKGFIESSNNEKTYLDNTIIFLFDNSMSNPIGFNCENKLLIAN